MAGVKGRSGGARKNAGGARPGAGRPRKEKPVGGLRVRKGLDPLDFLRQVQDDESIDPALRVRAAIEIMRAERSDEGKKALAGKRAGKAASSGRLAAVAPPSLTVVNK